MKEKDLGILQNVRVYLLIIIKLSSDEAIVLLIEESLICSHSMAAALKGFFFFLNELSIYLEEKLPPLTILNL